MTVGEVATVSFVVLTVIVVGVVVNVVMLAFHLGIILPPF